MVRPRWEYKVWSLGVFPWGAGGFQKGSGGFPWGAGRFQKGSGGFPSFGNLFRDFEEYTEQFTEQYTELEAKLEAKLNELGADGWELMERSDGFSFIFKREGCRVAD